MKKVREFIITKPLLSSVILVLLVQAIFHFDVWFFRINLFETLFNVSENVAETIKRLITTGCIILFMTKCLNGTIEDSSFTFRNSGRAFKICLIVIIFTSLFHASGLLSSIMNNEGHFVQSNEEIRNAIEITLTCLVVGIFEETAYRVATVNVLRNRQIPDERKKMLYCLVCSSVLFGLIHLPNIIGGYETPLMGTATIVNAAGFGMLLCSMYWISGSIIPSIILHFIWDLLTYKSYFYISNAVNSVSTSSASEIGAVVFSVITATIGILSALFVLRKKKYKGCKIALKTLADQNN